MKVLWIVVGSLLILAGLAGIVYVVGGVISQPPMYTGLSLPLWGAMAFHAVTTGLGTFCIGRGVGRKEAVTA